MHDQSFKLCMKIMPVLIKNQFNVIQLCIVYSLCIHCIFIVYSMCIHCSFCKDVQGQKLKINEKTREKTIYVQNCLTYWKRSKVSNWLTNNNVFFRSYRRVCLFVSSRNIYIFLRKVCCHQAGISCFKNNTTQIIEYLFQFLFSPIVCSQYVRDHF